MLASRTDFCLGVPLGRNVPDNDPGGNGPGSGRFTNGSESHGPAGGTVRIVHLIDTMEVGGMEKLVVLLCRWQRDQGHTPSVQCLYRVGTLGEQLRRDGFEVNCCDQEAGRRSGRVYRALVRQRPDVVAG